MVKDYQKQYNKSCSLVVGEQNLGQNSDNVLSFANIEYEQEMLNGVFSSWETLIPFYQ